MYADRHAINPGIPGPLLNLRGEVIGVIPQYALTARHRIRYPHQCGQGSVEICHEGKYSGRLLVSLWSYRRRSPTIWKLSGTEGVLISEVVRIDWQSWPPAL